MSAHATPLLSVIVPVAMGRGPYSRLFTWLPQATDHDLEVILVLDEFSHIVPPEFLSAVNKYATSKFKIVLGNFGSPGSARNFGLEQASGEWISFWDSDDLPNLKNFLEMVHQADSLQYEVAVGSFKWRNEIDPNNFKSYINPETIEEFIQSAGRTPGIWRFAAKRKKLINLFSTLQMAEDQEFLLANNLLSHKVFISTSEVYEYFTGSGIHQTSSPANFKDLRRAMKQTYKHYTNSNDCNSRTLATLFWLQQFGSNLKYGHGLNRIKTIIFGILQYLVSNYKFKISVFLSAKRIFRNRQVLSEHYKVIVPLTGGLGNQLFQLSAALSLANGAKVGLDTSIGSPRLSANGDAEIASFTLPQNVVFLPKSQRSKLIKKASGYMLRIGVSPKKFESSFLYRIFFGMLWNILMILSLKRLVITTSGVGVGHFQLRKRRLTHFIYGYFQSHIWPERSFDQLVKMKPLNESSSLAQYRSLAEVELPLIVHIRLGDYKLENNFGVPSKAYYSESISQLWDSSEYKKIWVFSDEPNEAAHYLPKQHLSKIRWIPEIDGSASHTLETMRLGKGFVIGNSIRMYK
jgi:glycosyltransferase involved in cell wall biosynthesis